MSDLAFLTRRAMKIRSSSTETIIEALRILARDVISGDGVANLALYEAADRMEELNEELKRMKDANLPRPT